MTFQIASSFLGIDWGAVSAIATVVLVVGAILELSLLRADARVARKPIISAQRAGIAPDGRLAVWLQNQGTGPALNIRLQFWLIPTDGYLRGKALTDAGTRYWRNSGAPPPAVEGIWPTLGAGQQDAIYEVGVFPELVRDREGWALLGYRVDAEDIHGHTTTAGRLKRLTRAIGVDSSRPTPGWISVKPMPRM